MKSFQIGRYGEDHMGSRVVRWAILAVGLLCCYFLIVVFHESHPFGVRIRARHLLVVFPFVFFAVYWLLEWSHRRQLLSTRALKVIAVSVLTALLVIVVVDSAVRVHYNVSTEAFFRKVPRSIDPVRWLAPSMPPQYHPTEKNFLINKPNVGMRAEVYGAAYKPYYKQSPTIVKSVLERKSIEYSIDERGFRETTPPQDAEIFALGDGVVEGLFSRVEDRWVEQLEQIIGEPIYNLGVGGSSPKQQLMLLEYLIQTRPSTFKVRHLLWMINESGDLEGSYNTYHGALEAESDPLNGPVLHALSSLGDGLGSLISILRCQSMIHRWIRVREGCERWNGNGHRGSHWVVDGVLLHRPLYHSDRYGYKAFDAVLIEKAAEGEPYVLDHPNRPLLDRTFEEMKSLSDRTGFRVTVLIAPNDVRLYAPYFEDFPPITGKPHFINYVEQLARSLGFEVINLYPLMQPYAAKELLNWRDDTHWNPRGERVVAEIVGSQLALATRRRMPSGRAGASRSIAIPTLAAP